MNLGEIRKDVRSLILEPTPGFRQNSELNRWINQAHQELGMLYKLETTKKVKTEIGVLFQPLPDDLLKFKGAWDADNNSIPIIPTASGADLHDTDTSDLPTAIFTYGSTFVLVPPPDITTEITLFYERKPKQLASDKDEPEIPAPYHRYLVSYATMRALDKDEAFEEAAVYEQEYENGKALIASQKSALDLETNTVMDLAQSGILDASEAAQWLNLPMKDKVKQRTLEGKALTLLNARVISKEDLIDRTVFPDKSEIADRLAQTASDLVPLPPMFDDDIDNGDSS